MIRPAKNAAKRDHILAAAKALFAEAGLEGASLRAIAARAGYTPAALYFRSGFIWAAGAWHRAGWGRGLIPV